LFYVYQFFRRLCCQCMGRRLIYRPISTAAGQ
jgi:hypothetical protein